MKATVKKQEQHARRRARVRAKVSGTEQRPRLSVSRSVSQMYVQLIDDVAGKTLCAASTKDVKSAEAGDRKGKTAQAFLVGKLIAEKARDKKIATIVFDRGGRAYTGRVRAVAEGAREGGLQF